MDEWMAKKKKNLTKDSGKSQGSSPSFSLPQATDHTVDRQWAQCGPSQWSSWQGLECDEGVGSRVSSGGRPESPCFPAGPGHGCPRPSAGRGGHSLLLPVLCFCRTS